MKGLEPPRIAPPGSKPGLSTIPTHPENLESPFDDPVTSFDNMVNEIWWGELYRKKRLGFFRPSWPTNYTITPLGRILELNQASFKNLDPVHRKKVIPTYGLSFHSDSNWGFKITNLVF